MSIVLGLLAAVAFGTGDLFAGVASHRLRPAIVTSGTGIVGVGTALVAVLLFPGDGASTKALLWGALAGVGTGAGGLCLYHGMTVGRISVVATLSGLFAAVIPVFVGLIGGDSLSLASAVGVVIAVPAIALVSWHPSRAEAGASGAIWGVLAGIGFALLFVALDRAGTESGAWPLLTTELAGVLVIAPLAILTLRAGGVEVSRTGALQAVIAGVLFGLANLAFLVATHTGQLAIVVVLTSLYPAVTVILARVFLADQWIRTQKIGLIAGFAAVLLVTAGSA